MEDLVALAIAAEAAGNAEEAVRLYKRALEADPRNVVALINLGALLSRNNDHWKAARLTKKALEIAPTYPLAHFNYANELDEVAKATGTMDLCLSEIKEHYHLAIKLDPKYPDPHWNLAVLHSQLGEWRSAIEHYGAYAKLDPTGPYHDTAVEKQKGLVALDALTIVFRNDKPRRTKRRAKLKLVS